MLKNLFCLSISLVFIGVSFSAPASALAAGENEGPTEEEIDLAIAGEGEKGYGEQSLFLISEIIILLSALIATIFFAMSAKGNSFLGYTAIGTAILGVTRLFYILADRGVILIHDDMLEVWWHLMFIAAIIIFILGWRQTEKDTGGVKLRAFWSTIGIVVLFSTAEMLNDTVVAAFDGTFWDAFGIQHFIALAISWFAIICMCGMKQHGNNHYIKYFIWMYGLFGLNHLWELLSESWGIIPLEDIIIERVEQLILLPAYLILFVMAYRTKFPKQENVQES